MSVQIGKSASHTFLGGPQGFVCRCFLFCSDAYIPKHKPRKKAHATSLLEKIIHHRDLKQGKKSSRDWPRQGKRERESERTGASEKAIERKERDADRHVVAELWAAVGLVAELPAGLLADGHGVGGGTIEPFFGAISMVDFTRANLTNVNYIDVCE
jgi:hypothetical protein